jgi:uncharacterized protein YeaC (DUF1315 family)
MSTDTFNIIASNLSEELYQEFKYALKSGNWRNGLLMSERQRNTCQQVILLREIQMTLPVNIH